MVRHGLAIALTVSALVVIGLALVLYDWVAGENHASIRSTVGNVSVVILGIESCPHCRAMKSFLDVIGVRWSFCSLEKRDCLKVFRLLYEAGVARGVPVCVVCRGTVVEAVVVGEVKDRLLWEEVLRDNDGDIDIYSGIKPVAIPVPIELRMKLEQLCTTG